MREPCAPSIDRVQEVVARLGVRRRLRSKPHEDATVPAGQYMARDMLQMQLVEIDSVPAAGPLHRDS